MSESRETLEALLDAVRSGAVDVGQAAGRLRAMQAEPLGFATLDHHRAQRCGTGEVVFAAGKTAEQSVTITRRLREAMVGRGEAGAVLLTRCSGEQVAALRGAFGDDVEVGERSGCVVVGEPVADERAEGTIAVVTAGTSDGAVAEEAVMTCRALGHPVREIHDVGVAGLHRLLGRLDEVRSARAVVCIAGMEGALPSVVGGLVDVPVVAVPTSVGYGANLGGLAALLGMLTSCASGVTVVNIDNGFGGAFAACQINRIWQHRDG
ncbi:MAG: nickel pincer cofactor biosynthesis protein LarB [Planctomycetota bacterium]